MPTIRDIAAAAGVSVGTASRALTGNGYTAEATKKLVLQVAEELGYVPVKRQRAKGESKTVGVILPDISFPFYANFLKYAEVELESLGYGTMIRNTLGVQGRVAPMLDMVDRGELAGLIINGAVTKAEVARLEKLPTVSFEWLLSPKIPMVASDHCQGGELAGELLVNAGCRRVLIFTLHNTSRLFADYRIEACRTALERSGAQVTVVEINSSVLSYRYLREVIVQYITLYPKLDGIFSDDTTACCCVSELLKRGSRIPEEVKVLGYDGLELAQITTPAITTIAQDTPAVAHACVDALMARIRQEAVPAEILVPVTVQKGGTV